MADKTGIAWCDSTWNPLRGCSKVSAGCKNCYAEKVAARFSGPGQPYEGTIRDGHWNGQIRIVPEMLSQPLKWKRPRRIFVNSMSDLFHEGVPFEYIAAVFAVMATARRHTFQVLTKRPIRALEFFRWLLGVRGAGSSSKAARDAYAGSCTAAGFHVGELCDVFDSADPWPLPNVHLGVSVEDQPTADARIPHLLACPAAVRFVSYEPALAAVDFTNIGRTTSDGMWRLNALRGVLFAEGRNEPVEGAHIDWIIVGGESGPSARPFDVAWARSTIEQCRAAGVACFVKQIGARPVWCSACQNVGAMLGRNLGVVECPECGGDGSVFHEPGTSPDLHLRDRAGADPAEWPEELRVQEFPA